MSDTAPVPLDVIQGNLQTQLEASDQMLDVISALAKRAGNDRDTGVSPEIRPELQKLLAISRNLRQSANGVVQAVVTKLDGAAAVAE
ncbi:MAG: hypothetical protein M3T55_06900 [Pseudomonadota bacterium]|nr:hypothetical protein [Pseudomonadota bacterium]